MRFCRPSRKPGNYAARVSAPIRRAQPRECGYEIHPAVIRNGLCEFFAARRRLKKSEVITQELNRTARVEYAALIRVNRLIAYFISDSRKKTAVGYKRQRAYVAKQEQPGTVSRLAVAVVETTLTYERGLLIARDTANGYRHSVIDELAYFFVARDYLRQRRPRNAEKFQQFVVVIEGFKVHQHRARRVRYIRDEHFAAGQFINQKTVYRSE